MTKTNQYKACPTRFDHCRDLFRDELSINQVILKIFTQGRRTLVVSMECLTKLKLNGETNFTCITVTSQCDQYVAKVINHWYLCHGL